MSKPPAKFLVITAHGQLDRTASVNAPAHLLTTCKFGEVHSPRHLQLRDISIFTNPRLLYDYILKGEDYTSGEKHDKTRKSYT